MCLYLFKDDISKLSKWVKNLKDFLNSRTDCSMEYTSNDIQGASELLTIYQQYVKYIGTDTVELRKLLQLVDILNSNNLDTYIYNPWLNYFVSCGVGEWSAIWNDIKNIFERNKNIMDFTFEDNRIYYTKDGKLLAEITFPEVEKGVFCINHTFVDSSLRGQGVAGKLMELAIDTIQKKDGKITATCSYAESWLEKHNIK